MAKFAFLIGAKPRKERSGPLVKLEAGNYIARLENIKDSIVVLCNAASVIDQLYDGTQYELQGNDYYAFIQHSGTELSINVSMELVR